MSAGVLGSVACAECLWLGCFGSEGKNHSPEEPKCSGNDIQK